MISSPSLMSSDRIAVRLPSVISVLTVTGLSFPSVFGTST